MTERTTGIVCWTSDCRTGPRRLLFCISDRRSHTLPRTCAYLRTHSQTASISDHEVFRFRYNVLYTLDFRLSGLFFRSSFQIMPPGEERLEIAGARDIFPRRMPFLSFNQHFLLFLFFVLFINFAFILFVSYRSCPHGRCVGRAARPVLWRESPRRRWVSLEGLSSQSFGWVLTT